MKVSYIKIPLACITLFMAFGVTIDTVKAQVSYQWMDVGSLHNFYSNIGTEIEQGFIDEQQSGLRWPAIYRSQDAQAAKGLWIGARDVVDENGNSYPYRVAHLGPRASGDGVYFPIESTAYSKFEDPVVFVDDLSSLQNAVDLDEIDPTLPADRMFYSRSNTIMGVTVERNVMQFSQEYHDNYHIIEFIFTNTGNVDDDEEIELPDQTLEDVVFYFQNRWAPVRATRFVMGNETGWGINTMIDRRGDGMQSGEPQDFRAHFAWHGYWEDADVEFDDNIGGPIWEPNTARGYLTESDTTGRLGAYHFLGRLTLHADASPDDPTDDPDQPFTMDEIHSDDDLNFQNDVFNLQDMQAEYERMTIGRTERHAFKVEPSGLSGFLEPSGDPSLGTSGGFSAASGYGPYTLEPGESVRIVVAEAVSGISRELANETGVQFKDGEISALEKNEVVFQGRDSLFQTFERAIANFESGYSAPEPPRPPQEFNIASGGDGIFLDWNYEDEANISGFEIYRAQGQVDSTYYKIYEASPSERSFVDGDDTSDPAGPPIRGRDYYYYITAIGNANDNDGGVMTPQIPLKSSRYYTQSYDPARLQRQAGEAMSEIRIVPNPYVGSASSDFSFDVENLDRVAFFEVPGQATIRIFTELGEHVRTIEHTDGSGDEYWDLRTESQQRVVSGVYIVVIDNNETGERATRKMAVIF